MSVPMANAMGKPRIFNPGVTIHAPPMPKNPPITPTENPMSKRPGQNILMPAAYTCRANPYSFTSLLFFRNQCSTIFRDVRSRPVCRMIRSVMNPSEAPRNAVKIVQYSPNMNGAVLY